MKSGSKGEDFNSHISFRSWMVRKSNFGTTDSTIHQYGHWWMKWPPCTLAIITKNFNRLVSCNLRLSEMKCHSLSESSVNFESIELKKSRTESGWQPSTFVKWQCVGRPIDHHCLQMALLKLKRPLLRFIFCCNLESQSRGGCEWGIDHISTTVPVAPVVSVCHGWVIHDCQSHTRLIHIPFVMIALTPTTISYTTL